MAFLDRYPQHLDAPNEVTHMQRSRQTHPHQDGHSPLHFALVNNKNDIAVELVRRGAHIPVLNVVGARPLSPRLWLPREDRFIGLLRPTDKLSLLFWLGRSQISTLWMRFVPPSLPPSLPLTPSGTLHPIG
jgi:hypothetical protein